MYSLTLITGRPGANKTLNTIKMIVQDKDHQNRVVFYHNIPLMFLDYSVCNSFQGFFYGVFRPSLQGNDKEHYQLLMERCHNQKRRVELKDVPHLEQQFDAWQYDGGLQLWLSWCRRVYSSSRLEPLENYLAINPDATFDQLEQFNLHWISFDNPTDWHLLPRPCRIVVDECQRWFLPRRPGSEVPKHISEFETVRHSGGDVFLITQHPKLIDSNIRRLVVNHYHFVRKLGMNRVIKYGFPDCADDPDDYHAKQSADKQTIQSDKTFFGLYHSADRHNYKFKLPRKAYFFIVVAVVLVLLLFLAYFRLFGGSNGDSSNHSGGAVSVADSSVAVVPGGLDNGSNFSQAPRSIQQVESEVLPITALSNQPHPLNSLCQKLSLAGHEDIRDSSGRTVRTYYLNCFTENVISYKAQASGSSSPGENQDGDFARNNNDQAQSKSYQERLLFTFDDLIQYGYQFTLSSNQTPMLVYGGQKYLLVNYN
ncbi:hypothetical protein IDAT_01070 [Pseudidiomarina atlantica]|uniref:Zona occludens toxin N-terminal domain-containing protein n=1 Tax=Pseudidiomarina atlantica TaxID=1517416 RepID=A0A094IPV9_9GAMM|nr:zonular occludens toxin domain-containing protein [Pseudidiomarina atlantica]KFZ29725.1 hypothetical protein IDAT_01070 [Pseudidiomarina atlantica]